MKHNIEVLKLGAAWCGPCNIYKKAFDYADKAFEEIPFRDIDIDNNPEFAQQFGVTTIPTTIILKDGEVVDRRVGAMVSRDLIQMVAEATR